MSGDVMRRKIRRGKIAGVRQLPAFAAATRYNGFEIMIRDWQWSAIVAAVNLAVGFGERVDWQSRSFEGGVR